MSVVAAALVHPVVRPGGGEHRRERGVLPVTVAAGVCTLPLLRPAGPGNTVLADLFILASVAVMALWAVRARIRLVCPYAPGVLLMMLGGALAAGLADAPLSSALVVVQDLLLLLWAATIASSGRDLDVLSAAVTAWSRFAPCYALVGVVGYVGGISALSGVTSADGVRASYTFGDPNYAGNYLVLSLFVVAAARRPRAPALRGASYAVMLVAIAFTGSNGAALTLLAGVAAALVVQAQRSHGTPLAVLVVALCATVLVVLVTLALPRVDVQGLRDQAAGSIPLLRDSVGRQGSGSERATITREGYALYLTGDATGWGPAQTKASLALSQAPYVKEAHNDYLATLLERGVVGCLGLLLLGAAAARRCTVLVTKTVPPALAEVVPRAWLLVAGLPVMACAGAFYEVLHFRQLWTWLGIVAALAWQAERNGHAAVRAS